MKSDSISTRAARKTKTPARLPESLNRRLNAYAMAAAASGVAVLACAMPAEGAPICKTVSIDLQTSNTFPLNPAQQFAPAFNVAQSQYTQYFYTTGVSQFFWWNRGFFEPNSAGAKVVLGANNLPADLAFGADIGPGGNFGKPTSYGLLFTYGRGTYGRVQGGGTKSQHRGNLSLLQSGYVGFQFAQAGQVHYGWARLAVTFKQGYFNKSYSSTHVLGYGYESSPNTAIAAGSCSTAENSEPSGPAELHPGSQAPSLGTLALGSESLAQWRNR
jgi:hypothetical protein